MVKGINEMEINMENQQSIINTAFYKELQCPFWVYLFDAVMSLFLCVLVYFCIQFAGDFDGSIRELLMCMCVFFPIFFVSGLLMNRLYVTVTPKEVTVQLVFFSLSPLKIELSSIVSTEVKSFRPMKDFGGWGIKRNKEVRGYFMSGPLGLLITMKNGDQYMIGSDTPYQLAKVINNLLHDKTETSNVS